MPPVASSVASSSAAPYDANLPKKKKLPACGSCKMRRVLCQPQPPPASCPRCIDKGIVCTTTPVVRKKPTGRTGKRIEEARATFGSAADQSKGPPALASATPWITPRIPQRITASATTSLSPADDLNNRLALTELTGMLAAHLLDLYQHVPQSWLPLFPRGRISQQFEAAGRRLDAMTPQTCVLAHIIIALTSRLSSHPLILPGLPAPPFEAVNLAAASLPDKDLRVFGRRREAVCEQFRENAVRLAWEKGTLVEAGEDSMAACFLLEMLQERHTFKGGKPYGSAYVSHLRSMLEGEDEGGPKVTNQQLGWSSLIMREALAAANSGRTSNFSAADDLLLCGEIPSSLEESLAQSVEHIDVRDSVTLFFTPMRPFTYHTARLARECSDKLTGTHSRRHPLDERYLSKFLNSLDNLYSLLIVLEARIAFVLSPAATAAHALPAPFETERVYIMRACLTTLQLAWASLTLPVFVELKRRIEVINQQSAQQNGNTENGKGREERRRLKERLEMLLGQVHRTTLKGALIVAKCVHDPISLAFNTHLQQERLHVWATILLESVVTEEGGESLTRREKMQALSWMNEGLKMVGWSWSADLEIIDDLEIGIQSLQLDDILNSSAALPSQNSNHTLQSNPALPSSAHQPLATAHIFGLSPPAAQSPNNPSAEYLQHQQSLLNFSNFFDQPSPAGGGNDSSAASTPFDFNTMLNTPLYGDSSAGGIPNGLGNVDPSAMGAGTSGLTGSGDMAVDGTGMDEWNNV